MKTIFISIFYFSVLFTLGSFRCAAVESSSPLHAEAANIAVLPSDGFNLCVNDQLDPHYVVMGVDPFVPSWFAGTLTNLPLDHQVTLGLSMAGSDVYGNKADVSKWAGLCPVMTYADPTKYETYGCYQRVEQTWVSLDPFKRGEERNAGNGPVPIQHVIPEALADQFLSPDGKYWSPWQDVANTEIVPAVNIFRIRQQFSASTATIALRIPYTYTYLQSVLEKIQAAHFPGVTVDIAGITPEHRQIPIIRLEDATTTVPINQRRTILVIAREHATEPASSWALQGMMMYLMSDTPDARALRKDMIWLFVPIEDPDGSAHALHERLSERFRQPNDPTLPPEILAYARYFTDYVNAGHSIDIALSLHNVEANEGPNLSCPFIYLKYKDDVQSVNQRIFDVARREGFATGLPDHPWEYGWANFRLYGWCGLHFGSLPLALEVNDRFPSERLTLTRLQELGIAIANALHTWSMGDRGQKWHQSVLAMLQKRRQQRLAYFSTVKYGEDQRSKYDMVTLGY